MVRNYIDGLAYENELKFEKDEYKFELTKNRNKSGTLPSTTIHYYWMLSILIKFNKLRQQARLQTFYPS